MWICLCSKAAIAEERSLETFFSTPEEEGCRCCLCLYTVCTFNAQAPVGKPSVLNSLDLIRRVECFEENQA